MNRAKPHHWNYRDLFGMKQGLIGMMLVADPHFDHPFIDGMERLILVVQEQVSPHEELEHWLKADVRIQVRRVTPETLERWVVSGDRNGVGWLVQGEVLADETGYLADLRRRLEAWPAVLKERKLLCEFSGFLRTYQMGKKDLQNGQVLDAYSNVLAALHYWAHIALVEQGMYPELTVWEQMRRVNPGIYKLYEELTTSAETMEERVQLVLLACEFTLLTKMRTSCALLSRIMVSRDKPWTIGELMQDPLLRGLPVDLPLLLQKMMQRSLVREVATPAGERGAGMLELRYCAG